MNVCCTNKLLANLGQKNIDREILDDQFLSWHAYLLNIERQKCLLLTNDKTLYTIFIPALIKQNLERIAHVIKESIFRNLIFEQLDQKYLKIVLQTTELLAFHKTYSRSVLGSMNDLSNQIDYLIFSYGGLADTPVYELNSRINRCPMRALKYDFPFDRLISELENRIANQ